VVESAKKQAGDVLEAVNREVPESARVETRRLGDKGVSDLAKDISSQGQAVLGKAQEDLRDVEIPKEKREELARRWRELMVNGIGQRKDFQQAWADLVNLASEAAGQIQRAFDALSKAARETTLQSEKDAQNAIQAAKELVENFSKRPLDPLLHRVTELANALPNDEDLQKVLNDARAFASRTYNEGVSEGKGDMDEYLNTALDLIDRARRVLLNKYDPQMRDILSEANQILDGLQNDTLTPASPLTSRIWSGTCSLTPAAARL